MALLRSGTGYLTGLVTVFLLTTPLPASEPGFSPEQILQTQKPVGTVSRLDEKEEVLLAGLYINGNDAGTITIYRENGEYWIPWDLFLEQTQLKAIGEEEGQTIYPTSIGTIRFKSDTLKSFENTRCVSFTSLKQLFRVFPSFNQSLYAVVLTIPWRPGAPQLQTSKTQPLPDIKAPGSSLSFFRIESDCMYNFTEKPDKNLLFETGGRILGGSWDITLEGDPEKEMVPGHYHWTTWNKNLAFRAGTGTADMYSLISDNTFTGVQFGWSNRSIQRYLDVERYSDSEIFLALDRTQLRTIEGEGPPAGIAELRLDGKITARQRITLEGKFIFRNVRMSGDLRKTEVYIYERSLAEKPLMVLDFTQTVASRTLPGGELLVRGGAGRTGNILDPDNEKRENTFFGQLQYGISNRLTLEVGAQHNNETGSTDLFAGTILSLGSNWTTALYGAESNNHHALEFRLDGSGKSWRSSWWSSMKNRFFGTDSAAEETVHTLNFSMQPFRNMTLSLYGRSEKEDNVLIREYLLPGIHWNVLPMIQVSAIPNEDEQYRYEAQFRFSAENNLRISYEQDLISADFFQDLSDNLKLRVIDEYALKTRDNVTTCYFDWYPGENRYDLIETGISCSGGRFGFSGSWSKYINAGLRFALRYSYNMNNAQALDIDELSFIDTASEPAQYLACALTWDIGWSGRRLYPINRTAVSITRGGIAGRLAIDDEDGSHSSSDINNVSILLNGKSMEQKQIDGSFFIGNLRPGIYRVSVDPEKLPVELVVDQKTLNVEVKSGTVTPVDLSVHALYGVAGRLTDSAGKGIPNVMVEITGNDGSPVQKCNSNDFGYYRAEKLRPGHYRVTVVSVNGMPVSDSVSRPFTIKDDYLFNIDLTITGTTAGQHP